MRIRDDQLHWLEMRWHASVDMHKLQTSNISGTNKFACILQMKTTTIWAQRHVNPVLTGGVLHTTIYWIDINDEIYVVCIIELQQARPDGH